MTDHELLLTISEQLKTVFNRLDRMGEHFDTMDDRFDKMNERFDKAEDILNILKFNQERMSEKVKGLEVTMNYNDYHTNHNIKKIQEDISTITEILKIHNLVPLS